MATWCAPQHGYYAWIVLRPNEKRKRPGSSAAVQPVQPVAGQRRQVIKAVEAARPDLGPAQVDAVVAEINKRVTMGSEQCCLAAVLCLSRLLHSFHSRVPSISSPRSAAASTQPPRSAAQHLGQIKDAMALLAIARVQEHFMRGAAHPRGIKLLPDEVVVVEKAELPAAAAQQLLKECQLREEWRTAREAALLQQVQGLAFLPTAPGPAAALAWSCQAPTTKACTSRARAPQPQLQPYHGLLKPPTSQTLPSPYSKSSTGLYPGPAADPSLKKQQLSKGQGQQGQQDHGRPQQQGQPAAGRSQPAAFDGSRTAAWSKLLLLGQLGLTGSDIARLQHLRRTMAARVIQQAVRAHLQRRRQEREMRAAQLRAARAAHDLRTQAATTIQRWWRGHLGRKHAAQARAAAQQVAARARVLSIARSLAARRIQAAWRFYKRRRRVARAMAASCAFHSRAAHLSLAVPEGTPTTGLTQSQLQGVVAQPAPGASKAGGLQAGAEEQLWPAGAVAAAVTIQAWVRGWLQRRSGAQWWRVGSAGLRWRRVQGRAWSSQAQFMARTYGVQEQLLAVVLEEEEAEQRARAEVAADARRHESAWSQWLDTQTAVAMAQQLPKGWIPHPHPETGSICFLDTRSGALHAHPPAMLQFQQFAAQQRQATDAAQSARRQHLHHQLQRLRLRAAQEQQRLLAVLHLELVQQDGVSRQLAFIGYSTEEQAAAAAKYFHKTFIDATRIEVEFARKYQDPALARPWSKHSAGSSAHARQTSVSLDTALEVPAGRSVKSSKPSKAVGPQLVNGSAEEAAVRALRLKKKLAGGAAPGGAAEAEEAEGGEGSRAARLAEFMALMAPRSRSRLWSNDEVAPQQSLADLQVSAASKPPKPSKASVLAKTPAAGKLRSAAGLEDSAAGSDPDSSSSSDSEGEEDVWDPDVGPVPPGGGAQGEGVVGDTSLSDLEYLKSRMKRWEEDVGEGEEEDEEEDKERVERGEDEDLPSQQGEGEESQQEEKEEGEEGRDAKGGEGPLPPPPENPTAAALAAAKQLGGGVGGAGGTPLLVPQDPAALIADTARLFVRNLAFTAREADLAELFGAYGDVSGVHLVQDKSTKKSRGVAYVQFVMPDDALSAWRALDGSIFQLKCKGVATGLCAVAWKKGQWTWGRLLHILPSQPAPNAGATGARDGGARVELGPGAVGQQQQQQAGEGGVEVGGGVEAGQRGRSKEGSSFKAAQAEKRKDQAGNRAAWNSLFMRPDTVVEAVAAHYGVPKSQLMDARQSGDLAVRVALGEAAVIAATKAALAEEGVSVEALEAAAAAAGAAAGQRTGVARSTNVLLVKNLPFSITEEEVRALFSRSGPLSRVVLPPSHTLALVEFCEPQDARAAFKALAYKKLHHVPLYLEWAPRDIFSQSASTKSSTAQPAPGTKAATQAAARAPIGAKAVQAEQGLASPAQAAGTAAKATGKQATGAAKAGVGAGQKGSQAPTAAAAAVDQGVPQGAVADGEEEEEAVASIYVKNLAFSTTDQALRDHFDKAVSALGGRLRSARVARRTPGPGQPGAGLSLSAGYGFVELDSAAIAAAVVQQLQGSLLDSHKLSLQLSRKRAVAPSGSKAAAGRAAGGAGAAAAGLEPEGTAGGAQQPALAKLVVRNVAFEATRKDIEGLFSPFGHLKSCRLPKKFDGSHRGFAFVEMTTKQEARNAMDGVTGTHLYGRRLVVEYAKAEAGLDELRAAAAHGLQEQLDTQPRGAKRLRKGL
ncbi:hypothetical protein V8C86DRAFT_3131565 [Haematococcus lacustris]